MCNESSLIDCVLTSRKGMGFDCSARISGTFSCMITPSEALSQCPWIA